MWVWLELRLVPHKTSILVTGNIYSQKTNLVHNEQSVLCGQRPFSHNLHLEEIGHEILYFQYGNRVDGFSHSYTILYYYI